MNVDFGMDVGKMLQSCCEAVMLHAPYFLSLFFVTWLVKKAVRMSRRIFFNMP